MRGLAFRTLPLGFGVLGFKLYNLVVFQLSEGFLEQGFG